MSKQLKEVIYINEADRPKKQEPLAFYQWLHENDSVGRNFANYNALDQEKLINEYADYRNSFKAEVKEVEFTHYLSPRKGFDQHEFQRKPNKNVSYLGKCMEHGDMFMDTDDFGNICIWKGHLNSGFYSVEI